MGKRANGEGSIYKRTDGRYCATLTVEGDKRKSFYGATRQEVSRKLNDALKSQREGLPVLRERYTVGQYLSEWLKSTEPSLQPRTFMRYEEIVRLHLAPMLGGTTLARLGPQHLQALYADRLEAGLSSTTVLQVHRVMRRALDQAARWGLVARNVATLVDAPRKRHREIKALTPDEVRSLLEAASGDRLEALYAVAVTSGMRQGELLALRWRFVDLTMGTAQVRGTLQRTREGLKIAEPKTARSRRLVRLTVTATEALRRHKACQAEERLRLGAAWADNDLVFANEVGRPIEATNLVSRSFAPLLKRAGLPRIRFHDLRHTAATLMLAQNVHAKVVSEMLGHSQISITLDLYSHVTPTMQQEATAAVDALLTGSS
jgi:integrase